MHRAVEEDNLKQVPTDLESCLIRNVEAGGILAVFLSTLLIGLTNWCAFVQYSD